PAAGARALTAERNGATLDLLVGSGVPIQALVVGKWLGAFLQVALVLLSGVPSFALVWLFGGVGFKVILLSAGLLIANAGLLVAVGMLAAALMPGELLATAAGAFFASLLFFATLAAFVAGAAGISGALLRVGTANPRLGLLAANPELAEALGKAVATPGSLPLYVSTTVGGRAFGAPLPLVGGLLYGALALLLLPLVGLL